MGEDLGEGITQKAVTYVSGFCESRMMGTTLSVLGKGMGMGMSLEIILLVLGRSMGTGKTLEYALSVCEIGTGLGSGTGMGQAHGIGYRPWLRQGS